uniref:Reverse transcriptase domain-containing protein n=1 Tax=Neogobius melanostomus TaxID=47308 RepID=A0A8C6WF21_9GOBI
MYSLSLFPLITRPTRINAHGATLIDNIFTNVLNNMTSGILINDISDHLPVLAQFDIQQKSNKNKSNTMVKNVRLTSDRSINALNQSLSDQDWNNVLGEQDVNIAYANFVNTIKQLYDQHCPLVTRKYTQTNKCVPWMTRGLLNACKKKNSLYKIFISKKTLETETKYKKYKNKLTSIIKKCKRSYYRNMIEANKNTMKGLWKVLNQAISKNSKTASYPDYMIKNDEKITEGKNIVNAFNDYFVNIGPHLASKIAKTNNDATKYKNINAHSFFLKATNENEVIKIVKAFKNKKSTDWNDFDMTMIKKVIQNISVPLTHICNLSFSTGEFPNHMKIAKVVPIYKSGDNHLFTNYRPISILPQLSKILEKLFAARLDSFINKYNLLSDCQYGFRNNRSTAHALINLTEEVTNHIDNKLYSLGIFIDLQKAFDTIDHKILLNKLQNNGIRGIANNWLKSYLTERKQYVQIEEHVSGWRNITCGVPQGSILGPQLFLLYINDLCEVSTKLKFILFADDTTILCSSKDLQLLISEVTTELHKLKEWFNRNKLSLNILKTKMILFGKRNSKVQIKINIENTQIEQVKEYTFLGVIFNHEVSWRPH